MIDVSSQNNSVSINVSSGGNSASIKATPDMAQYYSEKSREWAISNRIVDNTDYSSKYYAEKSKESEAKAENYERSVIEKYNSFVEVSNQAETELQTLRDDSISQINTVASSGISDIANKTSEAVTEINSNKEAATNEVNNAKNSAVTQLSKEAQKQLQNIESTGFYMRDDKLYFINSEGEEKEFKSGAGAVIFDTKISDHILEGNEAKGWALQGTYVDKFNYPSFYNKCLEEKNSAVATQTTLNEATLTMFIHSNGHQFYNLADKEVVDNFYEAYGIADFYGIDEENERIFLPRNKYFAITGIAPVIGNGNVLGLYAKATNGRDAEFSTWIGAISGTNGYVRVTANETGTPLDLDGTRPSSGPSDGFLRPLGVSLDPKFSGMEAKLSPNEKKYLYYCVGNTVVNDAQIDAGALVAQMGNKANIFLDNIIPSQGFKTSVCAYPMPSNKYNDKLELGATGTKYTAPANGWFIIYGIKTTAGYTLLLNTTNGFRTEARTTLNGTGCGCYIPVRKGDIVTCNYDGTYRSDRIWCFYYAEGEQ